MKQLSTCLNFHIISGIAFVFLLSSCNPVLNVRESISGKDFKNSQVESIRISKIDHPLLGGVIGLKDLNENEQIKFLSQFDELKKEGLCKCRSNYIISIFLQSDTIKLKYCSGMIAHRRSDEYYSLGSEADILEEFIDADLEANTLENTNLDPSNYNCDSLLGFWGSGNFFGIMGNIPPKVHFKDDGQGEIMFANSKEEFKWECWNDENIVLLESVNVKPQFIPGKYKYIYTQTEKHLKVDFINLDDEKLELGLGRPK